MGSDYTESNTSTDHNKNAKKSSMCLIIEVYMSYNMHVNIYVKKKNIPDYITLMLIKSSSVTIYLSQECIKP